MAVGVDYALFYVIRSREERHRGLPSHEALERTARTSGRTVLVSGTTVAIAMAGMFAIRSDVFNGIASGTVSPFWPRVVDRVLRRPVVSCLVAGGLLVALAVPALRMHVSKPSNDALASRSDATLASFAHIRERFPSTAAPALLVVSGPSGEQQAARR